MDSLFYARKGVLRDGIEGAVQSVAGFASLHVAITLLVALMVQYTLRNRILHIVFWVNFAITVVATLYFGWHYIADDIAGVAIALISLLARRPGQRPEVRPGRARLAPDVDHLAGPRRRRLTGRTLARRRSEDSQRSLIRAYVRHRPVGGTPRITTL